MKFIMVLTLLAIFAACNQDHNSKQLQGQIDSLQKKLNNLYKPGFGDLMGSIQIHHAKLWFAGSNNNWELADFEIHEIEEALEDIQKFNSDRSETKAIGMINPAMDSVSSAIKQKSPEQFRSNYILLTNTCNNCHKATEHAFNVVTIPSNPPVSNQSFKPVQ
jgi:hypothetical protein